MRVKTKRAKNRKKISFGRGIVTVTGSCGAPQPWEKRGDGAGHPVREKTTRLPLFVGGCLRPRASHATESERTGGNDGGSPCRDESAGRSGEAFAALCAQRDFESGLQTDDPSCEIFDVLLLSGDGGAELFDFIGEFDGGGEGVPNPLSESHGLLFRRVSV